MVSYPANSSIRVLVSMPAPDGTTKFVDQLAAHAKGIDYVYFSWRRALFSRYEVFHVHWPESLLRSRFRLVRLAKLAGTLALLVKLRIECVQIIRTVHNSAPHSNGGNLESAVLDIIDKRVSGYICLNNATPTRPGARRWVIPHGSYIEPFRDYPRAESTPTVLYFGRIEPYKGVDDLLAAFSELNPAGLALRLVGRPAAGIGDELRELCNTTPQISCDLRFVPDRQLVWEVTSSQLVVLPYKHMENSGAIFVALSLSRPVLAPRTAENELLEKEFGDSWIRLYTGGLTPAILREAIEWSSNDRPPGPEMDARTWQNVARAHYQVYAAITGHGPDA